MSSVSTSCKKCSLVFDSMNELNLHNYSVHLKGFMINTDVGSNIMFSRIGCGIYMCPTCFAVCKNFDEILLHLFCEIQENTISKKRKMADEKLERQEDSNTGHSYEFILTNSKNAVEEIGTVEHGNEPEENENISDQHCNNRRNGLIESLISTCAEIDDSILNADRETSMIQHQMVVSIVREFMNYDQVDCMLQKLGSIPGEFQEPYRFTNFSNSIPRKWKVVDNWKNCYKRLSETGLIVVNERKRIKRIFRLDWASVPDSFVAVERLDAFVF